MLDFGVLIEEMEKRMFSEELCNSMLDECHVLKKLAFDNKKEYLEAKTALEKLLSPENLALLKETEKTAFNFCHLSLTYAFRSGIYTGFKQMFSDEPMIKHKCRSIDELIPTEKIMRHARYYTLKASISAAFETLLTLSNDNEEIKNHIVSVEIVWRQRENNVLNLGFFLGYRYALLIYGRFDPAGKLRATPFILHTEYELGLCSTTEELEIQNRGYLEEDQEQLHDKFREILDTVDAIDDDE